MMFENEKIMEGGKRSPMDEYDCCSLQSSSPSDVPLCKTKDGLWNQDEVFRFISYLLFNR